MSEESNKIPGNPLVSPVSKPQNIAVIFAGGRGKRFSKTNVPKQFHELAGKPIIIYTIERFDRHDKIDGIIVVCLENWIPELKRLLKKFRISKVVEIVPGGTTAWASTYAGLACAAKHFSGDSIVLIHDGVRPLIDSETIDKNIETVKRYGSCITCSPAFESCMSKTSDGNAAIPERDDLLIIRAPQSFFLNRILTIYEKARQEKNPIFSDSCSMMNRYGAKMQTVIGPIENIKITVPADFLIFKAIEQARETANL